MEEQQEPVKELRTIVDLDDSIHLPAPSSAINDDMDDNFDSEDEDYMDDISTEGIPSLYMDWLDEIDREDVQMFAMMLYDIFVNRFKLPKTIALEEVHQCIGKTGRTVRYRMFGVQSPLDYLALLNRSWRKAHLSNQRSFDERRGKHQRYFALEDEEYKDMALSWVRSHSYKQGESNMTAMDFCTWVNSVLLPMVLEKDSKAPDKITVRTARQWLHWLGFELTTTKKGVYIDGHERADVVEYRKLYIKKLDIWDKTHLPPPMCADEPQPPSTPTSLPPLPSGQPRRKLVLIFHDESTFHSSDDQGWMWGEEGKTIIKPKGQGRGIMVIDFIDEHNGYLPLTNTEFEQGKLTYPDLKQEARVKLKLGRNSKVIGIVKNFCIKWLMQLK